MKHALELLELGPCHHMHEVIANPEQKRLWRAIARGDEPDSDQIVAGYRSAVDWPAAYFWRDLSVHYPKAKVILTLRRPESWYASMKKSIFKLLGQSDDRESVGVKLIAERVFGGRLGGRDHAISVCERSTADARGAFGSERFAHS